MGAKGAALQSVSLRDNNAESNLRTDGGMVANPWLFPGYHPGKQLDPQSIMMRLRKLGINLLGGRNSALQNLVADVPLPSRPNCWATATKSPSATPSSLPNPGPDTSGSAQYVRC